MRLRVFGGPGVGLAFVVLVGVVMRPSNARAQTPAPPKTIDVQAALGMKWLPRDPVAGLMFGDNGGFPQTSELGFSIVLAIQPRDWVVSPTFTFAYATSSRNRGYDQSVSTYDLDVGARKVFDVSGVQPFVGAGLGLGAVSLDWYSDGGMLSRGAGSGGFVEAGAFKRVRSILDVGLTIRYSSFWSSWFPTEKAQYWNAGGLFGGIIVGVAP